MLEHNHRQLESSIAALQSKVDEIHDFLIGNRLGKDGKHGWLEQVDDRLSELERLMGAIRKWSMAAAGVVGTVGVSLLTIVATNSTSAFMSWLGLR